jgi:hypothetical protein
MSGTSETRAFQASVARRNQKSRRWRRTAATIGWYAILLAIAFITVSRSPGCS